MSKKTNPPSPEQWKRLYELMDEIRGLAPWEFMYEDDIFGVQFPGTDNLGFVSVMGSLGEHLAIAIYEGKKGLEGFLTMEEMGDSLPAEVILQVPQIQAAFEGREMITPEDRKIMKQLNLKFRGAKAWPQFRSFRPACVPWYLEREEAQMLIHGLEQLMEVAPRFEEDPDLLDLPESDDEYLVRVRENEKWIDRPQKIKFPADPPLQLRINLDALNALKSMSKQNSIVEIDIRMLEEPAKDEKFDRPFFPFMLMLAEKQSHMILGVDLLPPLPSLEEMWELIPAKVTEVLASYLLPKELQIKNPLIALLLSPLEKELGLKIKLVPRLPTIERAQREFKRFTGR